MGELVGVYDRIVREQWAGKGIDEIALGANTESMDRMAISTHMEN